MPVISKIRFTNVIYEGGSKRYNDDLFLFDGHNAAILLENGGGKTVFIQTALQAVLPHKDMAGRKIRETLSLAGTPAHIAIEWIVNDSPRRYALTAVTLFLQNNELDSYRYVHEYEEGSAHSIEHLPFAKETVSGKKRPADKGEMQEYYSYMSSQHMNARTFATIKEYHAHLETHFQIIPSEWNNIAIINGAEGGVEIFFDNCRTTDQLVSQLLIPTVEDAMNGNSGEAFAEIFEKQREQFKQSKQLRMQIQESKLLEGQIQQFSRVFAQYDQAKTLFDQEKVWMKALFSHARKERADAEDELRKLAEQLAQAGEALQMIERKKASRDIAVQEKALQTSVAEWQSEKEQLDEKQREYDGLELQQYSLEHAKYKARRQAAAEKQALAEAQLKSLDEEQEMAHIIDDVERTKREIRGFYENAEKLLKQDEFFLRNQREALHAKKKQTQAEIEQARSQTEAKKQAQAAVQSRLEQTAAQMERIASKILDNPLQESVEASIPIWQEEIDKALANQQLYQQYIHECVKQKEFLAEKLEQMRRDVQALQEQSSHWSGKCQEAERQQETVLSAMKLAFPRLGYLDSLYTKQETVMQTAADKLALLEREKEEALQQERMATRKSDDYRHSTIFLADPELETLVARWRDTFHYLETGTQFVQEIVPQRDVSVDTLYDRFPYWAAVLITTDAETDQLVQRVKRHAEQLRNPVFVLSLQEARGLLEAAGEYPYQFREIIPSHWQDNLNQDRFESWKLAIRKKAEEVVQLRRNKERELQQLLELNNLLLNFYSYYPQEDYREWLKRRDELLEKISLFQKEIDQATEAVKKYEREWVSYKDKLAYEMSREQHLGNRLQEAKEYIQQKKQWEDAKKESDTLVGEIDLCQRNHAALLRTLHSLEGQEEELRSELEEKRGELARLQGEWLYQQVQALSPLPPQFSLERLRAELEALQALLRDQQASRAEWERQVELFRKEIDDCEKAMELIYAKASQPLDQEARFPLDGDGQLQRLTGKLVQLKKVLSAQRDIAERLNSKAASESSRLALMQENFAKQFPESEIDVFEGDLDEVRVHLEQEEASTLSRTAYLREQEKLAHHAARELDEVLHKLEIKNGTYSFLTSDGQGVSLPEADVLAFPYQRMGVVQKRLRELEEKHVPHRAGIQEGLIRKRPVQTLLRRHDKKCKIARYCLVRHRKQTYVH